jgi:cytochrome c oxidase cbb3-type subunit 2
MRARSAIPLGLVALLLAAPAAMADGVDLYASECAVCHGARGDGAGTMAHMFRVQPRDFRSGRFKFRSTPSGALPTDADLFRTLGEGVRWTAMIGRADLAADDRRAVLDVVKKFSVRFVTEAPATPLGVPPPPVSADATVERGRGLYEDAECSRCHGPRGRGDGPSAPGMRDDWGWPTWPTDLAWRPLKRGSSPESVYLTIATGLAGTPMPSYGEALASDETWALVRYLETLVPAHQRVARTRVLGDEARGWMALRMGRAHRMR